MKLTEAKLKQIILEALKSSKFQDFGIPTPDEKLRSQIGDANFDKIQALDQNQSDVMKQTLDPDYPERTQTDSLTDILESYGFEEMIFDTPDRSDFVYRTFERGRGPYYSFVFSYQVLPTAFISRRGDSRRYPKSIRYGFTLKKDYRVGLFQKKGSIQVPKMFDHDFLDAQERQNFESFIVKKEKDAIIKALEALP